MSVHVTAKERCGSRGHTLNRTTGTVDPLSKRTTALYDALGNLTQLTDRNQRTRQFSYDFLNRRRTETWLSSPSRTFTFTYNAAAELTAASDPDSAYTFTPDALGRATVTNFGRRSPRARVRRYEYDFLNRRRNKVWLPFGPLWGVWFFP